MGLPNVLAHSLRLHSTLELFFFFNLNFSPMALYIFYIVDVHYF